MEDLDLVGIDLAKNVFQLHGCSSTVLSQSFPEIDSAEFHQALYG